LSKRELWFLFIVCVIVDLIAVKEAPLWFENANSHYGYVMGRHTNGLGFFQECEVKSEVKLNQPVKRILGEYNDSKPMKFILIFLLWGFMFRGKTSIKPSSPRIC
jgi:hypothetical protein